MLERAVRRDCEERRAAEDRDGIPVDWAGEALEPVPAEPGPPVHVRLDQREGELA